MKTISIKLSKEQEAFWRQSDRDMENINNARIAKREGYPELKGSEKQVSWAETIRVKFVKSCKNTISLTRKQDGEAVAEAYEKSLKIMMSKVKDAGWWIDNRRKDPDDLLEDYINNSIIKGKEFSSTEEARAFLDNYYRELGLE